MREENQNVAFSPRRTVKQEVLSFLVPAALVILVFMLSSFTLREIESYTRKDIESKLQTTVQITLEAANRWAHERKIVADIWAQSPELLKNVKKLLAAPRERGELMQNPALEKLIDLLEPTIREMGFVGFIVIAPDYMNIGSFLKKNIGDKNPLADQGNTLEEVFSGKTVLSLPMPSEIPLPGYEDAGLEDMPTMFVIAPVRDENKAIIAALAFRLDASMDFTHIARLGRLFESGETYAFDKNGLLLTESRFDEQLRSLGLIDPKSRGALSMEIRDPGGDLTAGYKPEKPQDQWPLTYMAARAIKGGDGVNIDGYRDYRGVKVVGAWVWSDEFGYGLATEVDAEEAYHSYYVTRSIIITVVGVIATLFLFHSIVLMKSRKKALGLADRLANVNESLRREIIDRKRIERNLRRSRESLARAQRIARLGDWEWDIEKNESIWSDEVYGILGVENNGVAPSYDDLLKHVHPDDREMVAAKIYRAVSEKEPFSIEHRLLKPDGDERIVFTKGEVSRDESGNPVRMVGTIQDVTDRKLAEDRLEIATKVFENSIEGVMISDAEPRIWYVNPAFTSITGYSEKEAIGQKTNLLRSDRHDKAFYEKMWEALLSEGFWQGEIWNRRKNGEAYPEWLTITAIRDKHGRVTNYVAVFHDITEMKRNEEEIKYRENFDALTELPNRVLFKDRLDQAISRAEREDLSIAVMIVDLDRFKNINDSLGPAFGDLVLQETAKRLAGLMGDEDTLARLGGDEFIFLFENTANGREAVTFANKVAEALAKPFRMKEQEVYVTASMGIALFPDDGRNFETLAKNAEAAMYRAKSQGRNTYRLYTPTINTRALERLSLENALRKALDSEEFIVYYQPKLSIKTGEIVGAEALIRWSRPDTGLVSPADFIPLAEETGLITPIGKWALNEALIRAKAWSDKGYQDLSVAVNLSARQFLEPDLVSMVGKALEDTNLPAEGLELEITESTVMLDIESATQKMKELNGMGVRLSIDDFGTGYSSLSYLKRFPITSLKIDRSFVRDVIVDTDDAAISMLIIAMAHTLGLKVVAEGVETMDQLEFLREHNCDEMQGYLFSPPVPDMDFVKMLKSGKKLA